MPENTPRQGKIDRRGPILFGLMAVGVLLPHVYAPIVAFMAGLPLAPVLILRLLLWGGALLFLYLGYLGARWVVLAGAVLGAGTLAWQAVISFRAGYAVAAADFAVLALAQVGGAALLFGSGALRAWLKTRYLKRIGIVA